MNTDFATATAATAHPAPRRSSAQEQRLEAAAVAASVRSLVTACGLPSFERLERSLHEVAERIDAGSDGAEPALDALLRQLQTHPDPRCTGLMVFASALAQRFDGRGRDEANLYLRRFEVPQIQLFNLLGRHVPLAALATRVANDALARAIAGQSHPTLIDIGIGTGRQFAGLFAELAATGQLPPEVTVIGIEPGAEALEQARSTLHTAAAAFGMRLHFHGFARSAEALTDADWQAIRAACSSRPALCAAFALHHIADDAQGAEQRQAVLRRLHALDPSCLVIIEPDVDHFEPRFLPRFRNCYAHFGAVFGVLDALPLVQADRDALKVGFFGREIADILGHVDGPRSERHERASTWFQRLSLAGFAAQAPATRLPVSEQAWISVQPCASHVAIHAGAESVVAVFVAVPATEPVAPSKPCFHRGAFAFEMTAI